MNSYLDKDIQAIKAKITPALEKHRVVKAGIFGSFARGENRKNSDLDILVDFDKAKKVSLFDIVGLQSALEEKLKRKADVVLYNSIHPYLKERILSEEIRIYG